MPIRTEDVKIKASQRLTDNTDGGGFMTAREIVDGEINNMFTDISRLDRAYGRVSLRKGYVHVDTDDTEMYSGAHMIISELAKDPNVQVAIFRTENDADTRQNAVNRLESYVTLGPRSQYWLWEDQPAGSRILLMFCNSQAEAPEVGDVLCLFNNKDTAQEFRQYVRVMKVEEKLQNAGSGGESASTVKILTVEIGEPLEATIQGDELHGSWSKPTNVYTTVVSDAAKYYGVMKPRADIAQGDINIPVESIYTQLVPTSQAESPLINLTPGEVGPIKQCGETCSLTFPSQPWTNINIGQACVPGSLDLKIGAVALTDTGGGLLMNGSLQAGTVNYQTGLITLASKMTGAVAMSFDPGVAMSLVPSTFMVRVFAASRGYNYVAILWPAPMPGTIAVDYMAEGDWYRLRDNGAGVLVPDIEGTGTGRVDYSTGQLSVTCAALPDVDTPILVRWGNPVEIMQLQGRVAIYMDPVSHTVANVPVAPGSLSIEWPVSVNDTATAKDDGKGWIMQLPPGVADPQSPQAVKIGWINYGNGEMEFTPTLLPVAGSEYTIRHERYEKKVHTAGSAVFRLPDAPIEPGTLSMDVTTGHYGINHTFKLSDDGSGTMTTPGFTAQLSWSRTATESSYQYSSSRSSSHSSSSSSSSGNSSSSASSSGSSSHQGGSEGFAEGERERNATIVVEGFSATIDYVTGQVIFDMSTATGARYSIETRERSRTWSGSGSSSGSSSGGGSSGSGGASGPAVDIIGGSGTDNRGYTYSR